MFRQMWIAFQTRMFSGAARTIFELNQIAVVFTQHEFKISMRLWENVFLSAEKLGENVFSTPWKLEKAR